MSKFINTAMINSLSAACDELYKHKGRAAFTKILQGHGVRYVGDVISSMKEMDLIDTKVREGSKWIGQEPSPMLVRRILERAELIRDIKVAEHEQREQEQEEREREGEAEAQQEPTPEPVKQGKHPGDMTVDMAADKVAYWRSKIPVYMQTTKAKTLFKLGRLSLTWTTTKMEQI